MDKFANWLDGLTKSWMRWWKIRGLKVNIFDEETPKKKKSNPFYWIGGMLYILLILQVVVGIVLTFYYVPDTSPVEKVDPSKVMYGHGLTIEGAMKEAEEFRVKIDAGEMTEDELLTQEEITQRDEEKAALTTDEEKALVDTKWATITSQRKDILAMEGKTPEEIVADLGSYQKRTYLLRTSRATQ